MHSPLHATCPYPAPPAQVEEAGSQYEQAGDGNEDGFVIDEDMMYGRGEGQGRMGDGGGGQFAHYVDNMGMPISVRMLADESGLTDMRMPALVQLLGEALGGAARRGGGRAGAIRCVVGGGGQRGAVVELGGPHVAGRLPEWPCCEQSWSLAS